MKFLYLRDPLFLVCVIGYLANRFVLKPYLPNTFSIGYFNDLICVPFCLPVMLWGMRKSRLRTHDLPPQPAEVMISLFIWAVSFELLIPALPFFRNRVVADPMDILCYVAGALLATVIWQWYYGRPLRPTWGTDAEAPLVTRAGSPPG